MRKLDDLNVRGRTVFVRADFNVPLRDDGEIADDTRIQATLPTLHRLMALGAGKLVLASHLGRPKTFDPRLSLCPVAERLSALLGQRVELLPPDLAEAQSRVQTSPRGAVLLLENTRFYDGEERNDSALARRFAELADAYVDDAFGAAHRAHASTEALARLLPAAAGLLLQKEVEALQRLLNAPDHPFVAVLGGAKVSDKIKVIENLLPRVDCLMIGGAMANTFLVARGLSAGTSLVEPDRVDTARRLLHGAGCNKIVLPVDAVVAASLKGADAATTVPVDRAPVDQSIYDIGPATVELFSGHIESAETVFWNGPMGVFEVERFAAGTFEIARSIAASRGYSVVGGGDSVAAVERCGVAGQIGHISTGGGASLELLEGRELPGVAVLTSAYG